MRYVSDLHFHSKFSRATSKAMTLSEIVKWGKKKGIQLLASSDWTHPGWLAEIENNLVDNGSGFFTAKGDKDSPFFVLSTEISMIFRQSDKTRKIHLVIFAPNISSAKNIIRELEKIGNLWSDGRPILGISAKELTKIILNTCPDCLVVPAHAWTPWFSVFGSASGFDSLKECFEELTPNIYAIETGLSSDPKMNWRVSALDNLNLISCSDAHNPANMGRELTVFELDEPTYSEFYQAIKDKTNNKLSYTVEFFPEEGKYHFDGHRKCEVRLNPKETLKRSGTCPVCSRPLTLGVMYRVEKLADRETGKPKNAKDYLNLVPLQEIIAESLGQGKSTKKVQDEYEKMIANYDSEFAILVDISIDDLKKVALPKVVEGIEKVRNGDLVIEPGYDGEYGKVKIFSDKEIEPESKQTSLF